MAWIGGAIAGVGALIGGGMSANAAGDAAATQAASSAAATAEQRRQFDITQNNNAPFLQTGTAANGRLRQLLGLDGSQGGDSGSLTKNFTSADLNADPVYNSGLQFGLNQGTGAINARALANGNYDSGATLKALTQYGNDYGSTKANDAYNRFNTNNSNIFNRLSGVSGTGQTAVNTVATAGSNAATNIGNNIMGAGNASAAGIVGGANAWNGAIQNGVGAYNNYNSNQTMQKILQNNPNYNGGYGSGNGQGGGGYTNANGDQILYK